MLLSKLLAPIPTRYKLQHIIKIPKCIFSKQCTATDKGKFGLRPQISTSVSAESHCEKHQEPLRKCRMMQEKSDDKIGGAVDSRSKDTCDIGLHASEVFSRSLAQVRNEALTLQIFTRNSINAIAGSMGLENATRFKAERSYAIQRLQTAVNKIDLITAMNFACGTAKRNQCYAIHEQIFASLQVWQCENVAGEQSVKRRLEELECTVKERTDTAVAIVRTCKGCISPNNLIICVKASANDAKCIIKMTEEHVKNELASIQQLKTQILQENGNTIQQLMSAFTQAVVDFEKELNACIAEINKLQSR